MAPPLAGSMRMRLFPFLRLDAAGRAALYICSYFAVGYIFSDALKAVTRGYQAFGRVVGLVIVVLIAAYLAYQCWVWFRARGGRRVRFAAPADVAHNLAAGAEIYDVRSHGYFDAKAVRIRGSKRLDPHALNQADIALPNGESIYLYCTCAREATSARVARQLEERGIRVSVIRGGLRAWRRAGLPVEFVPAEELAALPMFR
ncbi:MAG: rhodanese-like domain-containing protein [Gammaproteobacteria bacterium]